MVPSVNLPNGVIKAINVKLDAAHVLLPDMGPFTLTEIVTLQEVLNPGFTDTDGMTRFGVIKYGRSTSWTAGISNELRSDCQRDR
jgi:hypothetical protein